MSQKTKYRIVKNSNGRYWAEKKVLWWWDEMFMGSDGSFEEAKAGLEKHINYKETIVCEL